MIKGIRAPDSDQSEGESPLDLRDRLACPSCFGRIDWAGNEIRCTSCHESYSVVDGVPILVVDRHAAGYDDLDHDIGHTGRNRQAKFFDQLSAAEFEIVRPPKAPRLYGWLLSEKFRRSVAPIRPALHGATALVVCGGSGMDAEFLSMSGCRVITSDISLGAAKRAVERANRHGLQLVSVVADVERLPFADRSIDIVYVHDGLHHLESPLPALHEMTRVAARGICITEPARAFLTSLAVRLRLAKEYEEAGNRVARLTLSEAVRELSKNEFQVVSAERYAMYYRHQPGRIFAALSTRGVFEVTTILWRLSNRIFGRLGNKLAITGVRDADG